MSKIGARIFMNLKRPPKELIDQFRDLPVANLDDCMNKMYAVSSHIKPINGRRICGPAITVKAASGDNLMFHKAMDIAQEGDIIVVTGIGDADRSFSGEIMLQYAIGRKLGGFLIDGYIRDVQGHLDKEFPVYAKGVQPNGPTAQNIGEINVPIAVGGQVVMPGDIIVGDMDGVVIVPQADAADLLEKAKAKHAFEQKVLERYRSQEIVVGAKKWIDERLTAQGCEIIDN